MDRSLLIAALAALTAPVAAQVPLQQLDPVVAPGGRLNASLTASPGLAAATFVDVANTPIRILRQDLFLGLTPYMFLLDAGLIPASGVRTTSLPIPNQAALHGLVLHAQGFVLTPLDPFLPIQLSNPASTAIVGTSLMIAESFDVPSQRHSGEFDRSVSGRLQALPLRTRLVRVGAMSSQAQRFSSGVHATLNPQGVRGHYVLRDTDLGGTGRREALLALHWKPHLTPLVTDSFEQLELLAGHSLVVPDPTIDPFTLLPKYPNSGLSNVFANNVLGATVSLYKGGYIVRQSLLRSDGYVPFPDLRPFVWDGTRSLLLEWRTRPSQTATGANGMSGYLNVLSYHKPAFMAQAIGQPAAPVDPDKVTQCLDKDANNFALDLQVELGTLDSIAESQWLKAPKSGPDYQTPIVAAVVPQGATVLVEYRGSRTGGGTLPTAWSANIDAIDGYDYLQYRVTLGLSPASFRAPSIDVLVIPVR
ncbi:MAG: hypothetical protein R3F30_15595 [Planctomycetota bacterium]